MAGRRWWRVRAAIVVIAALGISLRVGAAAFALTPPITTQLRDDCNPCVTVVDVPAYDETTTVVDQAAYDETVTVVDTLATTVARQVLVTVGHNQNVSTLVPGHYERGPDQRISQGYWQGAYVPYTYQTYDWVTSGYYSNDPTWVYQQLPPAGPSGVYVVSQTCTAYTGPFDDRTCTAYSYPSTWNAGGSYQLQGQTCTTTGNRDDGYETTCSGGSWVWVPVTLYGYVQQIINTYHNTSSYQWVSHSGTQWNAQYQWIDTSYWQATAAWVANQYITASTYIPSGSLQDVCVGGVWQWHAGLDDATCSSGNIAYGQWVSTAYTATPAQTWVDPVYTTVYDPVAAVTHQATVHHNAVTHTVVIHHDAITHQEQAPASTSQSTQGSGTGSGGSGTGTTASTPVTISVVSTITLIDSPASTHTVTVVDQAGYDETVSTAVYDTDCELSCHTYIDHYVTTTVHHAEVTHDVTTIVPAVTHEATLRYDAIVDSTGSAAGTGGTDDPAVALLGFGALLGMTALAGAGRFGSFRDTVAFTLAEWSGKGHVVTSDLKTLLAATVDDATTVPPDPPQDPPPPDPNVVAANAHRQGSLAVDPYVALAPCTPTNSAGGIVITGSDSPLTPSSAYFHWAGTPPSGADPNVALPLFDWIGSALDFKDGAAKANDGSIASRFGHEFEPANEPASAVFAAAQALDDYHRFLAEGDDPDTAWHRAALIAVTTTIGTEALTDAVAMRTKSSFKSGAAGLLGVPMFRMVGESISDVAFGFTPATVQANEQAKERFLAAHPEIIDAAEVMQTNRDRWTAAADLASNYRTNDWGGGSSYTGDYGTGGSLDESTRAAAIAAAEASTAANSADTTPSENLDTLSAFWASEHSYSSEPYDYSSGISREE